MTKRLVLDLDETLYDTRNYTLRVLKEIYGFELPGYNGYITGEITNGKSDRIFNEGSFMAKARLFPALAKEGGLSRLFTMVRSQGWSIVCCTHRGYHPRAKELSRSAFRRDGLTFDEEHYLCSTQYPCKMEFLDKTYGKNNYVLFDDNPSRERRDLTASPVILVDQVWNRDYAVCPTRRVKVDHLLTRIWSHVAIPTDGVSRKELTVQAIYQSRFQKE